MLIPDNTKTIIAKNSDSHDEHGLQVEGMICAACVRRIEGALNKVNGVKNATVNLLTAQATVHFERFLATMAQLEEAIVKTGDGVAPRQDEAVSPASQLTELETHDQTEHDQGHRDANQAGADRSGGPS